MRAEEITDAESLQAWLASLPQETDEQRETARRWAVTIAHRAAMRVLPVFWEWSFEDSARKHGWTALPILRPNLISGVAAVCPTPGIKTAVRAAAAAARVARVAAVTTARAAAATARATAATAARAATATASAAASTAAADAAVVWAEIKADCVSLETARDPVCDRFWQGDNPLKGLWDSMKPKVEQDIGWRFWVEWYENALHGRPQDYDLLTKIALIDPADWNKGADHVNALIQRIVAEHKPKPAPQPPEITDFERSHINLVLAAPDPARQSAEFLQKQFENMEQAYRRELGCPNETPPELEPIVTLSRTFGQIADLLRDVNDKDRLIIELTAKIRTLEANNAQLVSSLSGERGAFMRGVMMGALGNVAGAAIIQGFAYVVGPFASEALPSLWEFLKPDPELPAPTIPPVFDA